MSLTSSLSTFADIFLPSCLRSDSHTSPRPAHTTRQIICNQYGTRLYPLHIMPPTTRHQSRITEPDDDAVIETATISRRNSRSRSRSKSVARNESAKLEFEWERRQSRIALETNRSRTGSVATELEAEILERRQSKVVFQEESLERRQSKVETAESADSASSKKDRTLSMEMHEVVDSVHNDEDMCFSLKSDYFTLELISNRKRKRRSSTRNRNRTRVRQRTRDREP
jgi:hypothetical protein